MAPIVGVGLDLLKKREEAQKNRNGGVSNIKIKNVMSAVLRWGTHIIEQISSHLLSRDIAYAEPGKDYSKTRQHGPKLMYLADTEAQARQAVSRVITDVRSLEIHAIGLDCEKCADKRGGPDFTCVVQLASYANDGYAAVIRLKKLNPPPAELMALLQDETILKVGIDVEDDARALEHRYSRAFQVRGTLDLRWLAVMVKYPERGLKPLARKYLGVPKWRNRLDAREKWGKTKLLFSMLEYAADDAYFGVALFFHMFYKLVTEEKTRGKKWNDLTPAEKTEAIQWFRSQVADKLNQKFPHDKSMPEESSMVPIGFDVGTQQVLFQLK